MRLVLKEYEDSLNETLRLKKQADPTGSLFEQELAHLQDDMSLVGKEVVVKSAW